MIKITTAKGGIFVREQAEASREVEQAVDAILKDVRENGDRAIRAYTEKFDGVRVETVRVSEEEIASAWENTGEGLKRDLTLAAENIRLFHRQQLREGFRLEREDGIVVGQRVLPLESVGLYIPGGTASYPSSVLMHAIPASIAGVPRVAMATPPARDGKIPAQILCAAKIAGVTEIYKMGGAQAVAAFAYGTESVPPVCKIVGPGNIFVATAKRKVFGLVDIDMIAGPSEILVLADSSADPAFVAADMLSQAEHDRLASAVLVCDSMELAKRVSDELERQLPLLPRAEIARVSIDNNGRIIVAADLGEGVKIANELAPEHLEICVDSPFELLDNIRNAGSVFLGKYAPEALGDYWAGPNHTLPTLGTARFSSPLSVDEFIKRSSYIYYTSSALKKAKDSIINLAESEGLHAHARSAAIRFEADND